MDLIFEPTTGEEFSLSVGHFNTVLQIKEDIQKYRGIPVSAQTLVFDGNVLDDKLELFDSDIINSSHIQLIIHAPNPRKRSISTEESSSSSKKIRRRLIKKHGNNAEKHSINKLDTIDTIRSVNELLQAIVGNPMSQFFLGANGIEVEISIEPDMAEIEFSIESLSAAELQGPFEDVTEIEVSCEPLSTAELPGLSGDMAEIEFIFEQLFYDSTYT